MTEVMSEDIVSVVSSVIEEDIVDEDDVISVDDYEPMIKTTNIISVQESYNNYANKKRQTRPYINKYERAKILGMRAEQIAKGMRPLVPTKGKRNIYEIVEAEYKEGLIPLIIRRYLPNNTHEDWRLSDFVNI